MQDDLTALRAAINEFAASIRHLDHHIERISNCASHMENSRKEVTAAVAAIPKEANSLTSMYANLNAISASMLKLDRHITEEANRAGIAEGSMKSDIKELSARLIHLESHIQTQADRMTIAGRDFKNRIDQWVPARSSSFPVWLEGIEQQVQKLSIKDGALYQILREIADGRRKDSPPPSWTSEDEPDCERDIA